MPKQQKPQGGRPEYRPRLKDRETVEQMKFCGEPDAVIARALGIDVRTLAKHFAEELENGHANRRRQVIGLLFDAAAQKNVTAIKKLEEMGRIAGAVESVKNRGRATATPRLGKKEQQQIAAKATAAAGKFAVPDAPKLVVNNA